MHRDEWDDEDAEPGNFKRVALKIQFHEKIQIFMNTKL